MAFWQEKPLKEMTPQEWESLCDGCGQCCLHKLEDEKTGEIITTQTACHLFDSETCQCTQYQTRLQKVEQCIDIRFLALENYYWLPDTCAYRLLQQGLPLLSWHPLVSGDKNSVHTAGISVRDSGCA